MPPHNLTLTLIGASLALGRLVRLQCRIGRGGRWPGRHRNARDPDGHRRRALGWMFAEWISKGKPSVLGIASGAVAGLVAITPASGFVAPTGGRHHRRRGRSHLLLRRHFV